MPNGDVYWHRYVHDSYGESNTDGSGWDDRKPNTWGRLWPLLSGERGEYEEVRQGYRKHFGAFAPEWSADLHFGRSLQDYPPATARLQALWPTPLHAMQALDAMLLR